MEMLQNCTEKNPEKFVYCMLYIYMNVCQALKYINLRFKIEDCICTDVYQHSYDWTVL